MKKIKSSLLLLVVVLAVLNGSAQILKSNFPAPPKLVPAPTLPVKSNFNFSRTYACLFKGFGAGGGSNIGVAIAAEVEIKFNTDGTTNSISTWSSASPGASLVSYTGTYSMFSANYGRVIFNHAYGTTIYESYDFYLSDNGNAINFIYTQGANTLQMGTTYVAEGLGLSGSSVPSGSQYVFANDGFFSYSPVNRKTALGSITFGSGNSVYCTYTLSTAGVNTIETVSGTYSTNGNRIMITLSGSKSQTCSFQLLAANNYKTIYAISMDAGEVVTGKWSKF